MRQQNYFESEKHVRNEIIPVAKRVLKVINEFGPAQNVCSKIGFCNHVVQRIKELKSNIPQANGYITLVCEKYPLACELNQTELEIEGALEKGLD